jgi:hypothetical protein
MIPCYNRTKYLEKTLTSVLSQDPGPDEMQIEVVDDASAFNDPEPLMRRVGRNRVSFTRNPRNLGLVPNFNNCVERSRGYWVHILHTDDYVLPGFYERLKTALVDRSDVGAAFCRAVFVNGDSRRICEGGLESSTPGVLPDFIEKIAVSQRIVTPTIVVRRSVYEHLGGYLPELKYTPDWQMWIRIAAKYPIWYEPSALAACRLHSESETANLTRSGQTVKDIRRCIAISRSLLPPDRAVSLSRRARETASLQALSSAWDSLAKAQYRASLKHVGDGLRCSSSPRVIKTSLLLLAQAAKSILRAPVGMVQRGYNRAKVGVHQ